MAEKKGVSLVEHFEDLEILALNAQSFIS